MLTFCQNKTKQKIFFGLCFFALQLSSYVSSGQTDPRNFIKTWVATAPETNPGNLVTRTLLDVKLSSSYFDGLGRPEQTIMKQGSLTTTTNTDFVSPFVYDNNGRESQKYL